MNKAQIETHCQICARPIKSKNGVIAHHGYTQRGWGYRTASCFGARELPYEVSRDAISKALVSVRNALETEQANEIKWTATPPAKIEKKAKHSYDDDQVFIKPAGFDPQNNFRANWSGTYESAYDSLIRETQRNIKEIKAEIEFLTNRFDAWKPVEVTA